MVVVFYGLRPFLWLFHDFVARIRPGTISGATIRFWGVAVAVHSYGQVQVLGGTVPTNGHSKFRSHATVVDPVQSKGFAT
jgi:hypothetical protein